MISQEQYDQAVKQVEENQKVINQYHTEKADTFEKRMKENPIFTDEELLYSAYSLCPCGHGLAYPKNCGGFHYWDCSAILKGIAEKNVKHVDKMPFTFYSVKGESELNGTTRGVFKPQKISKENDA